MKPETRPSNFLNVMTILWILSNLRVRLHTDGSTLFITPPAGMIIPRDLNANIDHYKLVIIRALQIAGRGNPITHQVITQAREELQHAGLQTRLPLPNHQPNKEKQNAYTK